jgi:hypothetical protein
LFIILEKKELNEEFFKILANDYFKLYSEKNCKFLIKFFTGQELKDSHLVLQQICKVIDKTQLILLNR